MGEVYNSNEGHLGRVFKVNVKYRIVHDRRRLVRDLVPNLDDILLLIFLTEAFDFFTSQHFLLHGFECRIYW